MHLFGSIGPSLHQAGWPVIPLPAKKKAAAIKGWQNGFESEQIKRFASNGYAQGNVGLLAKKFPAADIDILDEACAQAVEQAIVMELGPAPVRIGLWPKRLLMYRTERPFSKIKVLIEKSDDKSQHAIEFLGEGQQYVVYGEHPDGFEYRWPGKDGPMDGEVDCLALIDESDVRRFIEVLPSYLPKGWKIKNEVQAKGESDALALYKPPLDDWPLERVKSQILDRLDPNMHHDEWVNVGMALHHQSSGSSEWLEAWDSWSILGESYEEGLCAKKWESFNQQLDRGQGALTLASLIKKVGDVNKEQFDVYLQRVEEAENFEAMTALMDEISQDLSINKINRSLLAHMIQKRLKAINSPLPVSEVRKLIRPKLTGDVPVWLDGWVYVTHEDRFFNLISKRKVTAIGFNAMFNREVGSMDAEMSASSLALDLFKIPTPDKIIYLPSAPEIFDMNGAPCVNSYDHNSPPEIPLHYTGQDQKAIETVLEHLRMILQDWPSIKIMVNWMAHNVQFPGKKIRWAPLIKGIEGDGKSVIGKLMGLVMGTANVGFVSAKTLSDGKYTGWADGKCINVLEEIRMVGHNRHDMLNSVKPYITNDIITVHPKHVNEYVAPNTVNYIAFTNHQDALPLEETDRRWWVQFTPFTSQKELVELAGPNYFDKLNRAIEDHYPALRKWLIDHQIDESFKPNGQAPESSDKLRMTSLNKSDEEEDLKEVIQEGGPGVCEEVISNNHLDALMKMSESVESVHGRTRAMHLKHLGYTKYHRQFKWNGRKVRLWYKGMRLNMMDEEELSKELRRLLDLTIKDEIL